MGNVLTLSSPLTMTFTRMDQALDTSEQALADS